MEISSKSPFGVRTRTKTLAIERLQKLSSVPSGDSFHFLQLRNRRLYKFVPPVVNPKEAPMKILNRPESNFNVVFAAGSSSVLLESNPSRFVEEILEDEEVDRKVRETSPSSLIRNPESTASIFREIDEFLKAAEQSQLKLFAEKYNYDPLNDCPLPGRYEWVKL